jgi:hypothetical protein
MARVSGWWASRAVTANSSAVLSTRAGEVRGITAGRFAAGALAAAGAFAAAGDFAPAGEFAAALAFAPGSDFVAAALAGAILDGAILDGAAPIADALYPAVAFGSDTAGVGVVGAIRRLDDSVVRIVSASGTGSDAPDRAPAPHATRLAASASRHAAAAWRLRIIGISKSAPCEDASTIAAG